MKRLRGTPRVIGAVFALIGIVLAIQHLAYARTPGYQSLLALAQFFTTTAIVLHLARIAIARRLAGTPPTAQPSNES